MRKIIVILIITFSYFHNTGLAQGVDFGLYIIGGVKSEKFRVIVNDSIYIFHFEKKRNWFEGAPNIGYINVTINQALNDGDKYPIQIRRKIGSSKRANVVIDDLYFLGCYPKYLFLLRSRFARKEYGYIARWSNKLLTGFPDDSILEDVVKYKADIVLPYNEANFLKDW